MVTLPDLNIASAFSFPPYDPLSPAINSILGKAFFSNAWISFGTHVPQFRHPFHNVFAAGIELLLLHQGLNILKLRRGIAPVRRSPLPIASVYTWIIVHKLPGKISLPKTPVDMQVLHKERSHNHSTLLCM
jgi:hypothetical protein